MNRKPVILVAHSALLFAVTVSAQPQGKCNIDKRDDPNNTIECYKEFPQSLSPHLKLGGWPKGTILKKAAEDSSVTLATLGEANHWADEEIEFTGKNSGEWAEVELRKFTKKFESCEESPKIKWTKRGWIKAKEKSGKSLVWKWLYNGLC
jgi:uncharacterized protein YeaC (DUF1315 family)